MKNQIMTVTTGKVNTLCSRLEARTFLIKVAHTKTGKLDDYDEEMAFKMIHHEILAGKHGIGNFVD